MIEKKVVVVNKKDFTPVKSNSTGVNLMELLSLSCQSKGHGCSMAPLRPGSQTPDGRHSQHSNPSVPAPVLVHGSAEETAHKKRAVMLCQAGQTQRCQVGWGGEESGLLCGLLTSEGTSAAKSAEVCLCAGASARVCAHYRSLSAGDGPRRAEPNGSERSRAVPIRAERRGAGLLWAGSQRPLWAAGGAIPWLGALLSRSGRYL